MSGQALDGHPSRPEPEGDQDGDEMAMARALILAAGVRTWAHPNPWVGVVLRSADGRIFEGATTAPGGPHAEVVALAGAGGAARGSTVFSTLEPCAHHGRTPPCADALVAAGVVRVVVALQDPDPSVAGRGLRRLSDAGIEVVLGVGAPAVSEQLAPYLKHRRTGRPWVVLKLAATLDGRTAATDGSSQWITGPEARADAHRLRAESDAVIVGAGTVRTDDPALTVRLAEGPEPLRVVLGRAPAAAKVHPALELEGDPAVVLDTLGARGCVQVLVEGGAAVAGAFHRAGVVDRYVIYLAPTLFGGDDGRALFAGTGAATLADAWRGSIVSIESMGGDLRLELAPEPATQPSVERSEAAHLAARPSVERSETDRPERRAKRACSGGTDMTVAEGDSPPFGASEASL